MDPLSLIGGVSAAGAIIAAITKTLKNLSDARTRFEGADLTIQSLVYELTTIKFALTQVQEWARNHVPSSPTKRELIQGFKISLEGCRLAMDVMAEEVAMLVSKNPFIRSVNVVWNDTSMKEHQHRLQSQVNALQFLLQAAYCQTETQQDVMLQKPKNRRILQKVEDDASTLRASIAQSQGDSPSILSHPESTIGSLQLDVDKDIVNTGPYRTALAHNASKLSAKQPHRSVSDSTNPFRRPPQRVATPAPTGETEDSGFYDMDADIVNPEAYRQTMAKSKPAEPFSRSASDGASHTPRKYESHFQPADASEEKDQLTPMERFQHEPWKKPRPYNRRASSPDPSESMSNIRHHPKQVRHAEPSNEPAISRQFSFSAPRQKTPPEIKKSFWGTITRKASRPNLHTLKPPSHSSQSSETLSPTAGSRRVKRKHEVNVHTSIDFGSPEGLKAPAIVRAAQSGSRMEILRLLEQRVDIEQRHEMSGRTALAVAAHCGNEEVVSLLLQRGAQVDVQDSLKRTPLHLAASRDHFNIVQLLLEDHASVDAVGPHGKTALRLAADNGHHDVVELLLQNRARVNARDDRNSTALHAASKLGDEMIVRLLIANGADFEAKDGELMTPLHYAASGDHDHVTEALLASKANIESLGKDNMTALSLACSAGAKQAAQVLLSRKANIKHKSDGDMTSLHWAAYNSHEEIVDLLLQQKRANVEVRNYEGRTPLHLAVQAQSFAATELLIRRGAAIEAECSSSLRPLHYACKNADLSLTQLLLGSGASIEATSRNKSRNALHFAILAEAPQVVTLLLQSGAQIEARDLKGERGLTLAASNGNLEILRILLDHGAVVALKHTTKHNRPRYSDSPLCKAAKAGHLPVIKELMFRGASIHSPDEQNCQPLRYAAYHGHSDIVSHLLAHGASLAILGLDPGSVEAGVGVMASLGFGFHDSVPKERREEVLKIIRGVTDSREEEARRERSLEGMQERVRERERLGVQTGNNEQWLMPRATFSPAEPDAGLRYELSA
ncbi:MAG: hypothetical protein M1820_002334 [Bogoriella megaspora]|nr:MAG: hypothetical protein M1820_002334 [Bogoriella megaspora]